MKVIYQKWYSLVIIAGLVFVIAMAGAWTQAKIMEHPAQVTPAKDRPIQSLRDLNQAFVDIAARVKPAVVTVSTERILRQRFPGMGGSPFANDPFFQFFFGGPQRQQPREREYRQQGLGSGVIVSPEGFILTNNHVIAKADSIVVRTLDGEEHPARVIGADPRTDIAVIKIDADDFSYIEIGDSDSLQVGEMVLAIGSPMSQNLAYTVTQGIVSATGRSNIGLAAYEDFIQTDAAINPGNSGGPLINMDGKLVGINTAIASQTGGNQGIGFAVPSNMARGVMSSLISEGKVVRGYLGVTIQDLTPEIAQGFGLDENKGALVGDVQEDSPASKAGLASGDVITSMSGTPIDNSTELRNRVAGTKPGTTVDLGILRGDKNMDLTVTLGEMPEDEAGSGNSAPSDLQERLGFAVNTLDDDLARQYDLDPQLTGAVVTAIDPSGNAAQSGLRTGDLIRSVGRNSVESADEFYNFLKDAKKGATVLLRVQRGDGGFWMTFAME